MSRNTSSCLLFVTKEVFLVTIAKQIIVYIGWYAMSALSCSFCKCWKRWMWLILLFIFSFSFFLWWIVRYQPLSKCWLFLLFMIIVVIAVSRDCFHLTLKFFLLINHHKTDISNSKHDYNSYSHLHMFENLL